MSTTAPDATRSSIQLRRLPTGELAVGRTPPGPAGIHIAPLDGAVALIDPAAAGAAPLQVMDAERAWPVISLLHGAQVADAAAKLGAAENGTVSAIEVEIDPVPTRDAAAFQRYGALRWLWHWDPLGLDRATLLLELHVAQANCSWLDTSASPLDLQALVPVLLAAADRALSSPTSGATDAANSPNAAGRLLAPLLCEAIAGVRAGQANQPASPTGLSVTTDALGPRLAELEQALARLAPYQLPDAAPRLGGLLTAPAIIAAPSPGAWGTTTIDWARVPPGVAPRVEHNVHWWVEVIGDQVVVAVRALAHQPRSRTGIGQLTHGDAGATHLLRPHLEPVAPAFRVYTDQLGTPLAQNGLHRDGEWWAGQVALDPQDVGERIIIDIHDPRFRAAPLIGESAVAAEAVRWASRGLAMTRMAHERLESVGGEVIPFWERARHLFTTINSPRQVARCEAMLVALYEALGHERAAVHARQSLAQLVRDERTVEPSDAELPDLQAPPWQPGYSELALIADQCVSAPDQSDGEP